jgi:hypothetical protein
MKPAGWMTCMTVLRVCTFANCETMTSPNSVARTNCTIPKYLLIYMLNLLAERSRGETISIRQLLADLGPASSASISPELKTKVVAMIQTAIEKMVEK